MKFILLLILSFFPLFCIGQITFEEVSTPNDVAIGVIRQSPTGERFIQAYNGHSSIFSTTNSGLDWMQASLPIAHRMNEIQFYTDGTPVLKPTDDAHMIRRVEDWELINLGGSESIKSSFIKDDTLFAYQGNSFIYSIDKGETFVTTFDYAGNIEDQSPNLWKFDTHYILHTITGNNDSLWVFDEQGTVVLSESLDLDGYFNVAFNTCGELLILDNDIYYLLQEDGLALEEGDPDIILQGLDPDKPIISQVGNYYLKDGSLIYRSEGCGFNWVEFTDNAGFSSNEFWVTEQEDIFRYGFLNNNYYELTFGASDWNEVVADIHYPYIGKIIESNVSDQIVTTANKLFQKNLIDVDWIESESFVNIPGIQFSPEDNFYKSPPTLVKFYYSTDNGANFDTINHAVGLSSPSLKVFNDDILVSYNFNYSYYSVNHGQDWSNIPSIAINQGFLNSKLVEDTIMVVKKYNAVYDLIKVDVTTNEFSTEELDFNADSTSYVILDNGTLYFYTSATSQGQSGLYRYQLGGQPEFLGAYEELNDGSLIAPHFNHELISIGSESCFIFDGINLDEFNFYGLPIDGSKEYYLNYQNYLYVTIEKNRIYRSTEPISQRYFVTGSVYNDLDVDCLPDPVDEKLSHWQVKVENDDYLRIKTVSDGGDYKIPVPPGDFTVSTQAVSENWEVCEPSFPVSVDVNNSQASQDFQAKGLVDCSELEIDFSTPSLRRCFDNYYSVRIRNTGPKASFGSLLTMELDPYFEFTSSTIPSQLNGTSLEFDLGEIALNEEITFYIYFELSCDAELGDLHCLTGTLTDDNLCNSATASYSECQENIGSFDPNDKRIFNAAGMEISTIEKDEFLYYHIRFQNTGTDTAFTVRVVDPLSPILNLETLEMLSASHSYSYEVAEGPELIVLFENILLPDSTTNQAASNGYFKFRIKPLDDTDYGTSIPNQAGIFFDFNEPIFTNEAIVTIEELVATSEPTSLIEIELFPNPTNNKITIHSEEKKSTPIDFIEIRNQLGQRVKKEQQANLSPEITVDVQELVSGIYYLIIISKGERVGMKKFVRL